MEGYQPRFLYLANTLVKWRLVRCVLYPMVFITLDDRIYS